MNVMGMVIEMLRAGMFRAEAAQKAGVSPRSVFNLCELQYLLVDKVKLTKSVSVKFLSFFSFRLLAAVQRSARECCSTTGFVKLSRLVS